MMMKVAIVTDTNSGITADEAKELGIFLLPMPVLIDGVGFLETVDIQTADVYAAMERDADISTSQPAPGALMDLWEDVLARGYDEIVYIPMTSGLSGSCHSAAILAEDFDGRVFVVDNRRISATQRLSIMEARAMAQSGSTAAQIKQYLEETALRASVYLSVDTLKYLQKGGRLSTSAALVGTLLNIKPVLFIGGEKIEPVAKVRGMKAAQKKMIESIEQEIHSRFSSYPAQNLRVMTAGTLRTEEEIAQWRDTVQAAFPDKDVFYSPLPCSIASHVGPSAMGIAVVVTEK